MREILFRGKRVDNKEWVISDCVFQCGGIVKLWDEPSRDGWVEVIPETVGQYTGLTDRNGKKIFEGDIVRYNDWYGFDITATAVVKIGEYQEEEAGLGEYTIDCYGVYAEIVKYELSEWMDYLPEYMRTQNLLSACKDCECEVIGNKWDNPELLEVENGCNER